MLYTACPEPYRQGAGLAPLFAMPGAPGCPSPLRMLGGESCDILYLQHRNWKFSFKLIIYQKL
jgi:hypothetical protein